MAHTISEQSVRAAIAHLRQFGDTDIFPRPFEIDAIADHEDGIQQYARKIDLRNHRWNGGARRCLVQKDRLGYRNATQLDPLDTLFLTAIIFEYGELFERARIPSREEVVFSYRFKPTRSGQLYGLEDQWTRFWRRSLAISKRPQNSIILVADVSDYYNQISHHAVENELTRCGLASGPTRCILNLLKSVTQTVSRGLPVGPQSTHLLAEVAFDPIDRGIRLQKRDYCRFVDDIHIGCASEQDALVALQHLASTLGIQQRLQPQRHKTRLVPRVQFFKECMQNLTDHPANANEEKIVRIVQRRTAGPYVAIATEELKPEDLKHLTRSNLEALLRAHLQADETNFARMRWLLRRLWQIGVPGAVAFVVKNIESLIPCISDACKYLAAAQHSFQDDWAELGSNILKALDNPYISQSEYVQAILIDLFAANPKLDNVESLLKRYPQAGPMVRRKIVLAAAAARTEYWIRERKEEWEATDPWLRRAIIAAARILQPDERQHWLRHVRKRSNLLERAVTHWAER